MPPSLELPLDLTDYDRSARRHVAANLKDPGSLEITYKAMESLQPRLAGIAIGKRPRLHKIEGAYKPSTAKLADLQTIALRGLVLDTRIVGHMLVVQIWHHPIDLGTITTDIEDSDGSVDVMQVHNSDLRITPSTLVPGVFLVIIEPWYINYGPCAVVRVDHPSDLVILDSGDPRVQRAFPGTTRAALTGDASALRSLGNNSFLDKQYATAEKLYTSGMCAYGPQDVALRQGLHRNRPLMRVHLGKFEMAYDDALAALLPDQDVGTAAHRRDNATTYYRHGRAPYEVGLFGEAQTSFEHAKDLDKTSD